MNHDTYVDDVQGGGDDIGDVKQFKEESTMIMKEGGFELYKWNSNVPEVDSDLLKSTKIPHNTFLVNRWNDKLI